MVSRIAALAVFGMALALPLPAYAQTEVLETGLARDYDTGVLLYREQHVLRRTGEGSPQERLVLYRCGDGTAFARKLVDYRGFPKAPSFSFEDVRSGFSEGVVRDAAASEVFVRRPGAERLQAPLPAGALVADAGFDQWVRASWPQLVAGERVPMRFLVPSRLASYDFKVYEVEQGNGQRRFRLRLGGLLGWFVPHIDVVYAEADRRLLRFEGLSNLRDDAGDDNLKVRIDFPTPPTPAAAGEWARFAAEPLRACRVGA